MLFSKRKILFLLFLLNTIAFYASAQQEAPIFERISYVFQLKPQLAKVWPGFDKTVYDVPLLYFTDSSTYVANPTPTFLAHYRPEQVYQDEVIRIYRTAERLDEEPFHMEVGVFSEGESTVSDPMMYASSLEETQKFVPDVNDTETWVTMIMHEYFHGFQFMHPAYLQWAQNTSFLSKDSLLDAYKTKAWYREAIDQENEALLLALAEQDPVQTIKHSQDFFRLREQRRQKSNQPEAIANAERFYETMEGTARYMEVKLYEAFQGKEAAPELSQADTAYHHYRYFKEFLLEDEPWLYLPKYTSYLYAIGFNITRLLDKLEVDYKSSLFKEPELFFRSPIEK